MCIGRSQLLLLAASAGIPQVLLAAPRKFRVFPAYFLCNDLDDMGPGKACSGKQLAIRNADPGIPIRLPHRPIPITPRPFVPAPRSNYSTSPVVTCKRAAGTVCRVDDFKDNELVKTLQRKGFDRQEALIRAQRAQPPTDLVLVGSVRNVESKYDVPASHENVRMVNAKSTGTEGESYHTANM